MRYWWVNQNRTFQHEVPGGYLWSPKKSRDGSINHFYETMREVAIGDLVFSYNDTKIMAIGAAVSPAYTCPKPEVFGTSGANWDDIGWRVDVRFRILSNQISPKLHMDLLLQFLPERYSPIRADGVGNQMYLAEISTSFAQALIALVGVEAEVVLQNAREEKVAREDQDAYLTKEADILSEWDEVQIDKIKNDMALRDTEKEQVIKARKGQGLFRNRVAVIERYCRVTHVDRLEHLIASHIKPWRVAANTERLDGANGLLLTPTIDHLFGKGYISFKNDGAVIISPVVDRFSLHKMGLSTEGDLTVGGFSKQQASYLEYHRDSILLKAKA